MEGLIPYVLHVLKNRREHGLYRSLSHPQGDSSRGSRLPLIDNKMGSFDGSSHRRTRSSSDFQPQQAHGGGANFVSDLRMRPQPSASSSSNYKPYDSQPRRVTKR